MTAKIKILDTGTGNSATERQVKVSSLLDQVAAAQGGGGGVTFAKQPRWTVNTSVAATGSTKTDSAAINEGITHVGGGDGTKGVHLPPNSVGAIVLIRNGGGGTLKVYPGATPNATINGLTTAFSVATTLPMMFVCMDALDWATFPHVAS